MYKLAEFFFSGLSRLHNIDTFEAAEMAPIGSPRDILIPIPWGHISGNVRGNPNGQRVLLVHGWTDNLGTFDLLIPLLSESYYLVCIELPGHGQSSHFPQGVPYNPIEYVVAIRRVIRNYLKWTKFDYIGHSLGGAIGITYSAIFPKEIEHFILIDALKILSWSSEDTYLNFGTMCKEFLALDRQKVGIRTMTFPMEKLKDLYVQVTGGKLNQQEAAILLKRGARKLKPGDNWAFTRDVVVRNPGLFRLSHSASLSILENNKCELLLMKATDSSFVEAEDICEATMKVFEKNCNLYEYIEVPGNHFLPLTNPTAVAPHINRFLLSNRNVEIS